MRRQSQEYDEEAARQPLLAAEGSGSGGSSRRRRSGDGGGGIGGIGGSGGSPARSPEGITAGGASEVRHAEDPRTGMTPGGTIRLTKRASTAAQEDDEQHHGIVLKDPDHDSSDVRELEVEVVAGAVAEAVAEAVQEAVQEAIHDAVQQAIEENVHFDVRANIYTLVAVTGVILFWRGVWNTWDAVFGVSLASCMGSLVVGLAIMCAIRMLDVPLVQGLPGG